MMELIHLKVNFDQTGSVIARISNVNNFDTSGEFSFKVTEPKNLSAVIILLILQMVLIFQDVKIIILVTSHHL